MAINFSKWDSMYKVSAEAVSDIKKNDNKDRVDVPVGKYEVSIQKMELTESKKSGDPMASVWFKVLNGEFKNQYIFMNQMLTNEYGIHRFNEFMRSLDTGIDISWTGSFAAYADLIDAVKGAVVPVAAVIPAFANGTLDAAVSVIVIKHIITSNRSIGAPICILSAFAIRLFTNPGDKNSI